MDRQTLRRYWPFFVCSPPTAAAPLGQGAAANAPCLWRTGTGPFGTPDQCGDGFGHLRALGEGARDGRGADLRPEAGVSASGRGTGPSTETETGFYWSKGERAPRHPVAEARNSRECRPCPGTRTPLHRPRPERGWMITMDTLHILPERRLRALQLRFPGPAAGFGDGIRYRTEADAAACRYGPARICADSATGMPYPYQVRYDSTAKGIPAAARAERAPHAANGSWRRSAVRPVVENQGDILFRRRAGWPERSCNRFRRR